MIINVFVYVKGGKVTRNVEIEEKMADLMTRIHELEKQNGQLKEKVSILLMFFFAFPPFLIFIGFNLLSEEHCEYC